MIKKWNNRILISMLAALMVMASVMVVPAFAADNIQLEHSVSQTDLKPGDTFTVDAKFTNFDAVAKNGLQGFQLEYKFDTSNLDFVSGESKTIGDSFTAEMYGAGDFLIALYFPMKSGEYLKPTGDILYTLTFKVKDNAVNGNYSLKLGENSVCVPGDGSQLSNTTVLNVSDSAISVKVSGGLDHRDDPSNADGAPSKYTDPAKTPSVSPDVSEHQDNNQQGGNTGANSDGQNQANTSHRYETVEEKDVSLAEGETISTASDGVKYIVDADGNIQKEIVSDGNRAPSSSNGALIAVIIVIVLVLAAGGVYALYYYKFRKPKDPFAGQSESNPSSGDDNSFEE